MWPPGHAYIMRECRYVWRFDYPEYELGHLEYTSSKSSLFTYRDT